MRGLKLTVAKHRLLRIAVLAVALMALVPGTAAALAITDYDVIAGSLGSNVSGPLTKSFAGIVSPGALTSNVYQNGSVYTYVLDVTPTVTGAWRLTTGFLPILAPTADVGYSSSDAAVASFPVDGGFTVVLNATNLAWQATPDNTWWGIGEQITFYFESAYAPVLGTYNLGASRNGTAQGWAPGTSIPAPVPEPGSLLLLGFGALALGAASRMLRLGGRTTRAG